MFRSPAIKKFVIDYLIEHSQETVHEAASRIHERLVRSFVANETVCIRSLGIVGRIVRMSRAGYAVLAPGDTERLLQHADIARSEDVSSSRIGEYIMGISMETPFGRVLKENAFESIRDSANILRCKAPANQRCDRPAPQSVQSPVPETKMPRSPKNKKLQREERREEAERRTMQIEKEEPAAKSNEVCALLELREDRRLAIRGFEAHRTECLMKIFSFLSNFKSFFKIGRIGLEELANALADPSYDSAVVLQIHSGLVEALQAEIDRRGVDAFAENIRPALMLAEELLSAGDTREKTRSAVDSGKSWRAATRAFLHRLSENIETDISALADSIEKRKSVDNSELEMRLVLVEFLLNCFFVTDTFRGMISNETENLRDLERSRKSIHGRLKDVRQQIRRSAEDCLESLAAQRAAIEKEQASIAERILESPLAVEMGCIDGVYFLNVDRRIYAIRDRVYYPVSRDMILRLYKRYSPRDKAEKGILLGLVEHAGMQADQ